MEYTSRQKTPTPAQDLHTAADLISTDPSHLLRYAPRLRPQAQSQTASPKTAKTEDHNNAKMKTRTPRAPAGPRITCGPDGFALCRAGALRRIVAAKVRYLVSPTNPRAFWFWVHGLGFGWARDVWVAVAPSTLPSIILEDRRCLSPCTSATSLRETCLDTVAICKSICRFTNTYTHTHTHTYIYIYNLYISLSHKKGPNCFRTLGRLHHGAGPRSGFELSCTKASHASRGKPGPHRCRSHVLRVSWQEHLERAP